MSPVSSERAKAVFWAAIEFNDAERRAQFLDQVCLDDGELRRRVEKLIQAHEFDSSRNNSESAAENSREGNDGTVDFSPLVQEGVMFGPYKLRERLGTGGMGVVWAADQKTPLRRRVALKLIKPGMDSEQVIARFEAEREALSLMEHPNIAKVLDAGTGPSGHPYFAMELVRGVPITQYCDEHRLSVDERVRLFTQVCYAIQHAHQKGIIHRDIKPSNVLVTLHDGVPVPKVIDFGVAKALHQRLSDLTVYTRVASAVGTPLYMSPEQAELSGLDIDTRSDIYSLGVLLYELITGEPPMSREFVSNSPFEEVKRVIREVEPQKPSTRVSGLGTNAARIANSRGTDTHRLARIIKGDLDWILLKTLEKDRTRRYATAQGLANDLVRYLNDEPVEATPPSFTYKFRKTVWRHRRGIALSLGSLAVVIAFAIGAYWLNQSRTEVIEAKKRERIREFDIPKIEQLADDGEFVDAYSLGRNALNLLSDDPMLTRAFARVSARASVNSNPPGARVEIARAMDKEPEWIPLEFITPISNELLPRGPLRLRFSKDGFHDRVMLAVLDGNSHLEVLLDKVDVCPEGMLGVVDRARRFYVDKYEVSNEDFKDFVSNGGYDNLANWTELIEDCGGEDQARELIATFVDDTSRKQGPRNWIDKEYPAGKGKEPVRGISWYEACAFARSRRKSLLAAPDWQSVATRELASYLLPLANYSNDGPLDCGRHCVVGGSGTYDMAGNVSEWTLTRDEGPSRRVCGGSYRDPSYVFFSNYVTVEATERPLNVGFRCAIYEEAPPSVGDTRSKQRYDNSLRIKPGEQWEWCLREFEYDRTLPFNARKVTSEKVNSSCRYEKVILDAPYGHDQFALHFFIPTEPSERLQAIVYLPGASSTRLVRFEDAKHLSDAKNVEEFVRAGRLVCWPELQGTFSRRHEERDFRQGFFQQVIDVRRTVDYLQHRGGIAEEKLALVGYSWGANISPMIAAVESRFDAIVLLAGGLANNGRGPELNPYAYAPYAKQPVLMFNGSRDHNHPIDLSQKPLLELFGAEKDQKSRLAGNFDHDIPPEKIGEVVNGWLDDQFGSTQKALD